MISTNTDQPDGAAPVDGSAVLRNDSQTHAAPREEPQRTVLYLSKLMTVFVTPLGALLALGTLSFVLLAAGRRRTGLVLLVLMLALTWIAAMPVTARFSLGLLERRHAPFAAADAPRADAAIVLGGAVGGPVPPRREADLGEASDRVLFAAELFRAGKVGKIVISGGNLPWTAAGEPEAEIIRRLLMFWGVPAEAIITGGASRTTAENAREVKALWPALGLSSALLVTSAAHMPRALATFEKQGLPVTAAPVDIRAVDDPLDALDFLPDAGALNDTSAAVKEAIGYAVYRVRGDL